MATSLRNGHANGASNGVPKSKRFSDIPATIDIPVQDQEDEAVEIDLEELADDPTELCTLFEMERAARTYWMTVALAYAKRRKIDFAIEILLRGANAMQANNPREKLSIVSCLCWLYLWKSREAPRVAPDGVPVSEAKTKEHYLQLATSSLNEASRINPAFPPLFLARGVLYLLRASLQPPSKATGPGPNAIDHDRADQLRSAIKSFEDAIKVSQGKNMLAVIGRSRAQYSLGKYQEALLGYQQVLTRMPEMVDPDPRIGIGCCFWQLGFKDDAKIAWERALEISPEAKIPNILLGLYHLDASAHVPTNSPEFIRLYKKAMTEYTQKSFKLDKNLPLTCATFANYFLSTKKMTNVDALAHKAIQYTDVNAIASDGWYLLARKEHYGGDTERASDYYRRADDARGGAERGYLPAKFGVAQLSVLKNDLGEAKLRLEKMIQQSKNYEAMVLLGTLYAEEVFTNQEATVKENKETEAKKAMGLLESARGYWKDPKKNLAPDAAVLLNLARLYEVDHPEKALDCLQQVELLELDQVRQTEQGAGSGDDAEARASLRKFLPPQLLNNIGCFHSQAGNHGLASEMFEAALSACVQISKDEDEDSDALVTTISFNLGRSYESRGLPDKATEIYESLLKRHDDYTDARARLAYLKLRKSPVKEGPDSVAKLFQENGSDMEVRSLYGWFLGRVHKRPANIVDDPEYRHHKKTLQNFDKHDRYALVAMGNMHLLSAREMRRETDSDKQKRSVAYGKAVEFFDKALQLDPKNAYAAEGVAIALVEDKKDYKNALQILSKVRETIKDAHVYVNLGHIYGELKQFTKAIENYEFALTKEGKAADAGILSCLGRTWLSKGRTEKNLEAYETALDYAKKALEVAPDQLHFQFNVAFVQIQLATFIHSRNETERTSLHLQDASDGLEAAIKALDEIANAKQPPYPKHDIEQRANMARNTQRKQLERALASQKEYELKHQEKLALALQHRQAGIQRREEEKRKAEEREKERQERLRKEREEIAARDREMAERRAEEDRQRADAEMTTDSETGERIKRKRKPAPRKEGGEPKAPRSRKKKAKKGEDDDDDEEEEERRPRKKQRLTSRKDSTKYKSAEIVVDSDEEENFDEAADRFSRQSSPLSEVDQEAEGEDRMDVDKEASAGEEDDVDERVTRRQPAKRARRGRIVDESDEENEDEEVVAAPSPEAQAKDTTMADDEDDE